GRRPRARGTPRARAGRLNHSAYEPAGPGRAAPAASDNQSPVSAAGLFLDVSPLRASRAFRVLWLSQLATTAGRQFVLVAVPYQVYVLTHSSLAVGVLGVFQAVPIVVAG